MAQTSELFAGILPFVHVAEHQSFRRAAQRLGVTTAAVSKAIAKLERDLGVALLARTSRSVVLTPEGMEFLVHARGAVAAATLGRDGARDRRESPHGEVHATMSGILSSRILGSLDRLTARHPGLSVRVTVTDRLVRLVDERIDVAVRLGKLEDSALGSRRLGRPRWATVASPRYLAALSDVPRVPDDLARCACLRFVGPEGRARSWSFLDPGARTVRSLAVAGPVRVDQGDGVVHAALAGVGVAQVLDFMVAPHLRDGRLVEILADHAAPGPEIHALWPRDRGRSPAVRAVVAFLREVFPAG